MIRYYVTDRHQADVIACVQSAVREGVDMIQVREKDLPSRELLDLVCKVRDCAAGTSTRVLVNGRLDIAIAARIDGIHLPSGGLPPARVRPFVGLVGVSTHTVAEAIEAEAARANFIVFGPVFPSPGKKDVGLEQLREVTSAVRIPVLAIGGVNEQNASRVVDAGAAGFAGIRVFQEGRGRRNREERDRSLL
jgi:thiamine-phosphate pyrophosphorylase